MEDSSVKLGLIFTIIILFISASLSPSISGNIEKIRNTSVNNFTINCSTGNAGLLAYWSFDEGSGSTAYDYSGHDYHGTIYGASWTTGYSGYALDFDGVDDCVSMNLYSSELGFNKTDDYKISAWINSELTGPGVVYMISDFDLVPIFYIKFNFDGTLEMKVQSTSSCIIKINSDDSYDDGLWHYIEGIYYGSSYPIIELYVDCVLVGSDTDWLCPLSSHQFKRAKIGMASYDSTELFNGIIDEVKVFKIPSGNQPPNAPIISGPTSGNVGEDYNYTFLATDEEEDDLYFWIDWGDNNTTGWIGPYSSGEEVNVSNSWSEINIFEIRAKVKDTFDISEWSAFLVVMGNLAPNKPSITGPTIGKKGQNIEYTFVSTDLNENDVKYFIDWGDSNTKWTDYYASGQKATLLHTWSEKGTFTIQAKAKDLEDAESDWADPFIVTITEKSIIMGFITNTSLNGELISFNAKLLIYICLKPLYGKFYLSGEEIIISREYTGKISEQYIIGIFDAIVI